MSIITLIGVDPGVIHSGVVQIKLDTVAQHVAVRQQLIDGPDAEAIYAAVTDFTTADNYVLSIEKYEDRGTAFQTHGPMRKVENDLVRMLPEAQVLSNTGIKKTVTDGLMKLFGVWTFNQTSHHQDLRSAARIAMLGGLKHPHINTAMAKYVMSVI